MTRRRRLIVATGSALALGIAALGIAQIEGNDRGVPPIDSSANYEVGGIQVDVVGKSAQQARMVGWRLAQRRGWAQLWAKANALSAAQAPALSDGQLDQIVAGVSIEDEKIGAHRYIARLGVLFDRGRAGDLLGAHGGGPRSAPTLVIPVMWSGGVAQSFERRTDWQKAWARFRSGGSPIDYVRPVGTGLDPLLLNVAQAGRPGRGWWRTILDQYGAADVVVPTVHLERRYPGGPVIAHFIAFHGPDSQEVARFDLVARDSGDMARMLDEGVRRIDQAYADAFRYGGLIADPSLVTEPAAVADLSEEPVVEENSDSQAAAAAASSGPTQAFDIQVDTPDSTTQTSIEAALRALPGVRTAATSSLALGGISVMRVEFAGDQAALRAAAFAAGLQLREEGGV
uniref:heavy-metal-associated domain-containing protein n=1 Tax=Sphingomonas bacterium TaxID=1895847 RepID=UPI0015759CF8